MILNKRLLLAVIISLSIALLAKTILSAADTQDNQPMDRRAIDAMIDSLANKNKQPVLVQVQTGIGIDHNPLFSDDYDWNEDERVRKIANELSHLDGEDLWWSLIAHLDDPRYAIAYGFNGEPHIRSVGVLCWDKAAIDFEWFFFHFAPRSDLDGRPLRPFSVLRTPSDLKDWLNSHKDVPLYKQQIELAELALKKLERELPSIEKYRHISDTEKADYIANVNKQMATLEETKTPILGHRPLLIGGCEFYDAKVAKEIREKYEKTK